MPNWIEYPLQLTGNLVELLPLEEHHFSELKELAKDKRIWEHYIYDGSDSARFQEILESALALREKGSQFPFVIFHKVDKRIIGSTRFLDIQPVHKKLEIGSTWVQPDFWGSAVNLECKFLLLTYAFETLYAKRVQFKTDENNVRSRKAIEKIGGQFEGILRNDMLRDNNTLRNSAVYSIIEGEWEENKMKLTKLLRNK